MTDEWSLSVEEREALWKRREERGIDYDLVAAIEYNPDGNRNADDIARVLAVHQGERDDEDWVWLVEFEDGARGCYIGGCDYTGWDCQSALTLHPFDGWEERVREEWPEWRRTPVETVIATLTTGLEGSRS